MYIHYRTAAGYLNCGSSYMYIHYRARPHTGCITNFGAPKDIWIVGLVYVYPLSGSTPHWLHQTLQMLFSQTRTPEISAWIKKYKFFYTVALFNEKTVVGSNQMLSLLCGCMHIHKSTKQLSVHTNTSTIVDLMSVPTFEWRQKVFFWTNLYCIIFLESTAIMVHYYRLLTK